MKHQLVRDVAEVDVEHPDITLLRRVGKRPVMMRVLPRPLSGQMVRLMNGSVLVILCIDQLHIAVVFLGLLVHQLKDTRDTCKAECNHRDLHGCLADGLRQLPGHGQK